jgi:8-oxo-dGTP diphosphatase
MKNFPITTEDNKTYWISRSCTTETIIFNKVNGEWCVLANKRGKGCTNNVGLWNVPAGYLEYNETLEDCAVRETFEETGAKIDKNNLNLFEVDSTCDEEHKSQNVIVAYWTTTDYESQTLTDSNSDPDEVDEIKWVPILELKNYQWISKKHYDRIKRAFISCANKNLCEKRYKS